MRGLLVFLVFLWTSPAAADETCLSPPYLPGAEGAEARIASLIGPVTGYLDGYPSLLESFEDSGVRICFASRLDGARAYFEPDNMKIVLEPDLPPALAKGIMLHEIRHLDQYMRGSCVPPRLSMPEHARAVAAMEADASTVSLLIAWELKQTGDPSVWSALAAWPVQADIAAAMQATFEAGGDTTSAASAAFTQWFAREDRVLLYYRSSCSEYLDRMERTHALSSDGTLADTYLDALCRLPDGTAYACRTPEDRR
jgi:hypothetical protein